jgi:hypothetical protein
MTQIEVTMLMRGRQGRLAMLIDLETQVRRLHAKQRAQYAPQYDAGTDETLPDPSLRLAHRPIPIESVQTVFLISTGNSPLIKVGQPQITTVSRNYR